MKKLLSLLLSAVLVSSLFTACRQEKPAENGKWQPDIEYWEKAVAENTAEVRFSMGSMGDEYIDPARWLEVMNTLEMWKTETIHYSFSAVYQSQAVFSMHNNADDSRLHIRFMNDLDYAAVWTRDVGDIQFFSVNENPQLIQMLESTERYISRESRVPALDMAEKAVFNWDIKKIASMEKENPNAQPVEIPEGLALADIANVHAYGDGKNICVSLFARYEDGAGAQYNYALWFYIDPRLWEITHTDIVEMTNPDIVFAPYYPRAEIGGVDYSLWIDKLDYPYHNEFYYALGGSNGENCSSSIEFCTDIMYTLQHLQLGEKADIDMQGYETGRHNIIRLFEKSHNYELGSHLRLVFVQDCRYVAVCPHKVEHGVCHKGDAVYEVKNPQSVQQLFEKHHTYISTEDYESLKKYVTDFITGTPPQKLAQLSETEITLPEKMTAGTQLINFDVSDLDNYGDLDNTDDYYISFRFFGHDELADTYATYSAAMIADKTASGWEIMDFIIRKE